MSLLSYTPKKKIILFGPPGAGKGTLTGLLLKFLPNIVHISTGDIFRENISKKTPLGLNAKSYIEKGALVPDEVTIAMVEDRLSREDVQNNGFILDGFPRTIEQARALSEFTLSDIFILIDPPRDVLIQRITGRYSCQRCNTIYNKFILKPKHEGVCDKCGSEIEFKQRADDTEEALVKRLDGYEKKSKAIVDYYDKLGILKKVKKAFVLELTPNEVKNLMDLLILNICTPIQCKSADISEDLKKHLEVKPNIIELRLDYIDNPKDITLDFFNRVKAQLKGKSVKAILTLRHSSEGGMLKIADSERLKILKTMINTNPHYIDIEMSSSDDLLREVVSLAIKNDVRIIFSYHDYEKTPTYEDAMKLVDDFDKRIHEILSIDERTLQKFLYKLIFTAKCFEDNYVPIDLCKNLAEHRRRIVSFCMGQEGTMSRVICPRYGSFFTYASVGEQTAPGQIHITKMRAGHTTLFNT